MTAKKELKAGGGSGDFFNREICEIREKRQKNPRDHSGLLKSHSLPIGRPQGFIVPVFFRVIGVFRGFNSLNINREVGGANEDFLTAKYAKYAKKGKRAQETIAAC